ncbi:MAG: hypothetical protein ABSE64_08195 [Vulcanimicrobiaceae bacterium]|jgi:hypothetical protein
MFLIHAFMLWATLVTGGAFGGHGAEFGSSRSGGVHAADTSGGGPSGG